MNLKRRLFGLFMAVFTLCGCVSTVHLDAKDTLVLKQANVANEPEVFKIEVETVVSTLEDMPAAVYAEYDGTGGIPWIASRVAGNPTTITEDYFVTKDANGKIISRTPILGSKKIVEASAPVMKFGGSVAEGSEFFPRVTFYGVDCVGCVGQFTGSGGTAAGVKLNSNAVRQSNGEWKEGITYDGYYILAADPSIPMCSIVTVYDHTYSGDGLQPGVPFKAMVLDRGGAIRGSKVDLYVGSERSYEVRGHGGSQPRVVIERVGGFCGA